MQCASHGACHQCFSRCLSPADFPPADFPQMSGDHCRSRAQIRIKYGIAYERIHSDQPIRNFKREYGPMKTDLLADAFYPPPFLNPFAPLFLRKSARFSNRLCQLPLSQLAKDIDIFKMSGKMSGACHRRLFVTGVLFPASLRDAEQLRSIRNRPVRNVQPGNSLEFVIVGNDCVW